jgi:CzcA family heavy metal efflux pump
MLALLVRFSIRHAGIIVALALLLVVYGGYRFAVADLDIFPEFSPRQVIIQTEAPGLAAEQVEIRVTQPIESRIGGLMGLQSIRSESIQGLSIVTAIFTEDTDIYRNRQLVTERLSGLSSELPEGVSPPVPLPLSSSSATVLTIGLSSDDKDLMELRSLVDWTLKPRLLSIPGVADVNIFGGEIKQLQIQIDPARLFKFNLSITEVVEAVKQAGRLQGSGFIENSNQRHTLTLSHLNQTPEQLAQLIIKTDQGRSLSLGEVAIIDYGPEPAIGAAQIMGSPGIVMMVIGQYGANTLTVSKAVEAVLAEFDTLLTHQNIRFYPHLFRPADYIETSVANLQSHLLLGGIFVVVVLYLFLFNFKTALISATAIPVSLISALLVLLEQGVNLNIMVLGGLAIALGEVVDDAIIDTENIFRRLRQNRLKNAPLPIHEVVFQASMEVRSSVVYASFIVALAFIPLLTLPDIAGRLFSPLGYSYILAIMMSLLVALTLTPALCFLLLKQSVSQVQSNQEPPLICWLKPFYRRILLGVNQHFYICLSASLLLCLSGLLIFGQLDNKFLPELREGHYIVHTTSMPGTSLAESIRTGIQITQQLRSIPGVESVSQWAGRAERGADTFGSHYSEYEVRLYPADGQQQQSILNSIRAILDALPGIAYEANTFLTERVDETISGYTSPVVVNVYGNDLNQLDQKARAIAKIIAGLPGADDVQIRSPAHTPLIEIIPDPVRLRLWQILPEQLAMALNTAYSGQIINQVYDGNRIINSAVILAPSFRQYPETLAELPLRSASGELIRLSQVADIRHGEGRYNVLRQGAQRKQTITANVTEGDMTQFMSTLKQQIETHIRFPANNYPELTGAAIEQQAAKDKLILHSLLAGAGVLMFIYMAIANIRNVLLTLVNLPFALIGGVMAVIITDAHLSVGSVVGFVTLFGITVRNSIMLLSHYRYLTITEKRAWTLETLIAGAEERLPSILMTALVTALAMLPIAFNSDNPGREIMGPMASIIIGGLASSTVLNLLLLPAFLYRYGDFKIETLDRF